VSPLNLLEEMDTVSCLPASKLLEERDAVSLVPPSNLLHYYV
jgi:hypothetical protein